MIYKWIILEIITAKMQVTGEKDIKNITRVELKVVTKQAGLHRLAEYTPRLKVLILDGSNVDSLRDLGSSLKLLENLSVCRCSLKSLDGLWGFPNLSTFLARNNSITDISTCSGLTKLAVLDVTNNEIESLSSFAFLKNCKHLRVLDVAGNRFNDYKDVITKLVPQVRILDGEEIKKAGNSIKGKAKSHTMTDEASEGENLNVISENKDMKATLTSIKKKDMEDSSLMKNNSPKPETCTRELVLSNRVPETKDQTFRDCENDREKLIEENDRKIRAKEINLDPSSTSIFLMTHEFDRISMFDLNSEIGKYQHRLETMPSKLSSGRAICGNLAASLRSRKLSKNPFTLPAARTNLPNE